jgi:Uma2 family endonuclease
MALTLELPHHEAQLEFNLHRWAELLADSAVAKVEGRIETDRYGHVVMSPPPAPIHGSYQSRIAALLDGLMTTGRVMTECPISTADGVKAADVAWASPDRVRKLGQGPCFPQAPEICVEVVSPGNTNAELREKTALYFDAGAREVWLCAGNGIMSFYAPGVLEPLAASLICPRFPKQVELR